MARRQGATDEQLGALARGDYTGFPDAWQSALRYAEAMTPTPGKVPRELFDVLAQHWTDAQMVELTAVIALFNYFNRFANALDIPPTK